MSYIPPNIKIFINYSEYKRYQPLPYIGFDIFDKIENIFFQDRLIVLAEPGMGKTELLNRIVENSVDNKFESILIDLKSIDLSLTLKGNIILKSTQSDINKTSNFKLKDSNKVIICFDALDEVQPAKLLSVHDKIKSFMNEFPKVKSIITCRNHYFNNFEDLFTGIKYKFLGVYPFYRDQVYDYLNKNSYSKDEIDLVFKNYFNNNRQSIIQTPRYLCLLVEYLKEEVMSSLTTVKRTDIFEHFISNKLKKESSITKSQNNHLHQRILEKLALIMEINQINRISKDDLMTIFEEVSGNLTIPIQSQSFLNDFFNKSLLKNNIDFIEFDNTEFQEYLAAKCLSRFGKLEQSLFDLAVKKEINEIYPSWFNVLNYLIELKIELLKPILDFGLNSNEIVDKEFFQLITNANVDLLSNVDKCHIFEIVYKYYQKNKLTIEPELERNLSYYYQSSNQQLLIESIEQNYKSDYNNHIIIRNTFSIVFNVIERGKFTKGDITYWKKKAFDIIIDKEANKYLKKDLIYIVKYLNDKNILKELKQFWENEDQDFKESLLRICIELDPNNDVTVEFIIKALNNKYSLTSYGISQINSNEMLKKFFNKLNSHYLLIQKFYEVLDNKSKLKILNNIKEVADTSLISILEDFIINGYKVKNNSYMNITGFQIDIAKLISQFNRLFVFRLLNDLSDSKEVHQYQLPNLYSKILKKAQIKNFIIKCRKIYKDDNIAMHTLMSAYSKNDYKLKSVYEEGRKYFPKEYKIYEADKRKYENLQKNHDNIVELKLTKDFKKFLDLSSTGYFYDYLFINYSRDSIIIDKSLSRKDKLKMISLVTHVLKTFNPLTSGLKIIKAENSSINYNIHRWINPYGECILCADLLGIEIGDFKQNIINYIPFSYENHLKSIFNLIKSITPNEFDPIMNVYDNKKDDLWRFMTDNFFRVVEKYNIKAALPIVKKFIFFENHHLKQRSFDYRSQALILCESLEPNIKLLKSVFFKFKNDTESQLLINTANSLLISNHNNIEAIKWRMKTIINRAFPYNRVRKSSVVYTPTSNESELREKRFASPLMNVNDIKFEKLYLDFFEKSFIIQKRGNKFEVYGHYIRDIVLKYYDNLKCYRSFEPLNNLEKKIIKYENEDGYGWLFDNLRNLKRQYIEYIGKPDTIIESVKKYNSVKNIQYENISTSKDLLELIVKIIKNELNNWIKGEGLKIISSLKSNGKFNETSLQKILKIKFENLLLKNGLRKDDISIHRESQLLDDKRTDFLIGYGFIKPILIELKLSSNTDLIGNKLDAKKSYKNLKQYILDYSVDFGILLVFECKNRNYSLWIEHFNKINGFYKKIPGVIVLGIPTK